MQARRVMFLHQEALAVRPAAAAAAFGLAGLLEIAALVVFGERITACSHYPPPLNRRRVGVPSGDSAGRVSWARARSMWAISSLVTTGTGSEMIA
ncbi:hypothetical protein D9M70_651750 [compost metagenome]